MYTNPEKVSKKVQHGVIQFLAGVHGTTIHNHDPESNPGIPDYGNKP